MESFDVIDLTDEQTDRVRDDLLNIPGTRFLAVWGGMLVISGAAWWGIYEGAVAAFNLIR